MDEYSSKNVMKLKEGSSYICRKHVLKDINLKHHNLFRCSQIQEKIGTLEKKNLTDTIRMEYENWSICRNGRNNN